MTSYFGTNFNYTYPEHTKNGYTMPDVVRGYNPESRACNNGETNIKTHDADGNVISNIYKDATGNTTSESISMYNENGLLTREYYDNDGDNIIDEVRYYEYYENGELKTEKWDKNFNMDDSYNYVAEYDKNGNKISVKDYDDSGNLLNSEEVKQESSALQKFLKWLGF